jgi:hypothetical protein
VKFCKRFCIVFLLVALFTGCSLIPKPVELGAKKVKPVPEMSIQDTEALKQTADLAARKADQTVQAALLEGSSDVVLAPAKETAGLSRSVSFNLGPPEAQWRAETDALTARLDAITGRLNRQVDQYRKSVEPLVGKKIAGTGWLQVPYFLWVGGVVLAAFLVWQGVKIVGAIYPPVGIVSSGLGGVGRMGAKALSGAVTQIVKGGEEFKTALDQSGIEASIVEKVKELFTASHKSAQDESVKTMVDKLTTKG